MKDTERVSLAEALLILGMWVLAVAVAYGNLARNLGYQHTQYWPSIVMAGGAGVVTVLVFIEFRL